MRTSALSTMSLVWFAWRSNVETIGLFPTIFLTSDMMWPSMSSWPSLTPAPCRWRATPSMGSAPLIPSRISPSSVSKASSVIFADGVAEAKTVGTSSKPCFVQPSMRPPTGVLVPPKRSNTSSPRRRSLFLNWSRSVRMVDRTFVSWEMVPVTTRMMTTSCRGYRLSQENVVGRSASCEEAPHEIPFAVAIFPFW